MDDQRDYAEEAANRELRDEPYTETTAWVAFDRMMLDTNMVAVVVLEHDQFGDRTSTLPLFRGRTNVRYDAGEHEEAIRQAVDLLNEAGWRIAGPWKYTDTGCVAAVAKHDPQGENAGLIARTTKAIEYMRTVFAGEAMVMEALSREAAMTKRAIPVVDAEEALCILIERGWTWAQIARVNS